MKDATLELKLIQQARTGDADAFCRLYGMYKDRLYRYAFYRLGTPADAEDAVSECVLAAWKQIGQVRDPEAFPAWIFRILSGCCARLVRRQIEARSRDSLEHKMETGREGDLPATCEDPDGWLQLQEALGTLSEEERDIVLLSCVGGLKSGEIADLIGKTPGSVRSSLSRSLKKVRGYYE